MKMAPLIGFQPNNMQALQILLSLVFFLFTTVLALPSLDIQFGTRQEGICFSSCMDRCIRKSHEILKKSPEEITNRESVRHQLTHQFVRTRASPQKHAPRYVFLDVLVRA
jgi:hypothetical protein